MVVPVFSAVSSGSKAGGTSSLIMEAMEQAAGDDWTGFNDQLNRITEMNQGDPNYTKISVETIRRLCEEANELGEARPMLLDRALRKGEYMAVRGMLKELRGQNRFLCGELWKDLFRHHELFDQQIAIYRMQKHFCHLLEHHFNDYNDTPIFVCSGHMSQMHGGILSSIGRGYTDYTATLIASAVGAQELQIWKESAGVFGANPSIVPDADMLDTVTVDELVELTAFGNEVVHPLAAQLIKDSNFETSIMDIFDPSRGTKIIDWYEHITEQCTAICSQSGLTLVDLVCAERSPGPEFLQSIFTAFAEKGVHAKLVSTSMGHVSVVFESGHDRERTASLITRLKALGIKTDKKDEKSIVACVGQGMKGKTGTAAAITDVFALQGINIEMLSQECTEISVCAVIDDKNCARAVEELHSVLIQGNGYY